MLEGEAPLGWDSPAGPCRGVLGVTCALHSPPSQSTLPPRPGGHGRLSVPGWFSQVLCTLPGRLLFQGRGHIYLIAVGMEAICPSFQHVFQVGEEKRVIPFRRCHPTTLFFQEKRNQAKLKVALARKARRESMSHPFPVLLFSGTRGLGKVGPAHYEGNKE